MSRRSKRRLVYAVAAVILLAGAYLSFELGRYEAGYSLLDQRRSAADHRKRIAELERSLDDVRRDLAIEKTGREVDRATYAEVESTLGELQARIQAQEEELVFYRGIVSPQDGVAGPRVQSLEVVPGEAGRYELRLVLVQAIVHNRRVAGAVKLQLTGLRDGLTTSLDVAGLVPEGGSYDMAYQFRYFQGLECELELPAGFEPQSIGVEIRPSEPRGEPVTQSFDWAPLASG